jgi:hypothetical protein
MAVGKSHDSAELENLARVPSVSVGLGSRKSSDMSPLERWHRTGQELPESSRQQRHVIEALQTL